MSKWSSSSRVFGFAVLSCALACGLMAGCAKDGPSSPPTESFAQASTRLHELLEGYFERTLELNPIRASFIGDHRFDDHLANDIGPAYRAASLELEHESLAALHSIPREVLGRQDRLSWDIFREERERAIEGFRYPSHLIPVSQFFSTPNFFAMLGSGTSVHPFRNEKDYQNFLHRASDFAIWVDQAIANMREGMAKGIVQPRVLMAKALPQLKAMLVDDPEKSLFYRPLTKFPETVDTGAAARLRAEYRRAISEEIVPAYRRLHDFIRDEYLPHTRETVALSALPGGREWYAYRVREITTTEMTPDEIHELGLREVSRLRKKIEVLSNELGFGSNLAAFFQDLEQNERFYYGTADELLAAYRSVKSRVATNLSRLFSRFPRADFEIRPIETFRAASAAAASYAPPSADGTRPGVFYVNTYDLKARPGFHVESIYAHEAIPGHHFQIALTQEIEGLPRFRRFGGNTAYIEGWGLYAELLGAELGLYTDPYQRYGQLDNEIWRAIRLVVDTGIHARGWSRERALEFMLANSAIPETDAIAEVERYIAIPGQALAYKIGQLRISELRQRAEAALGSDFDIRAYHAQVLEDGPLPLDLLSAKINRWIGRRRAAH